MHSLEVGQVPQRLETLTHFPQTEVVLELARRRINSAHARTEKDQGAHLFDVLQVCFHVRLDDLVEVFANQRGLLLLDSFKVNLLLLLCGIVVEGL